MFTGRLISITGRAKFVTVMTSLFALIYHCCFLLVFFLLKLYPMVYFNIFSILIFAILSIAITKTKSYIIPFFIGDIEVILHQILAEYFLGAQTDFHFFILLMCILPYLIFEDHIRMAFFSSFLNVLIFSCIQIFSYMFTGVYEISESTIKIIQIVNISISISVITLSIFIFAFIVRKIEYALKNEVYNQAKQLQEQNENLINIQNNTIISLSNLVENRDSDTGEHVRRTSSYVGLLARKTMESGLYTNIINEHYINLLIRSAPLHDIGKIIISDTILKKPGKLSVEEFEAMKSHTTEGGRIVHEIIGSSGDTEYIEIASQIAKYHHEKWDGSGYPEGLQKDEIPLSARIMALADVFDALVSPRCYKAPLSLDEAFKIIRESSGKHFDPILSNIFIENRKEIEEIFHKYQD